MDWLLEYEKVFYLIINAVFIGSSICIGWKGLDTLKDYHKRKLINSNIGINSSIKTQALEQLDDLIKMISKVNCSFNKSTRKFSNFDSNVDNMDDLNVLLQNLRDYEERLEDVIFESYLVSVMFIGQTQRYHQIIGDYRRTLLEWLEYAHRNKLSFEDVFMKEELFDDEGSMTGTFEYLADSDIGQASLLHNQLSTNVRERYRDIQSLIHSNDYSQFIKDIKIEGEDNNGN